MKRLVEAFGPAGDEAGIREVIASEISGLPVDVQTDPLGNLIVKKSGNGRRIMLSAHMDEIGVMVTHICEKGFLRFAPIGGLSPMTLLGQRVRFANGTVGVFGVEKLDALKDLSLEKLFIDIGASSKEQVLEQVRIGDVAQIWREMTDLGERVVAKSMDDRIGCAILIQVLRELSDSPHEIYFVFSTQEEVGLRGAKTAAYGIDPEIGIAVDVTLTGDTPKAHTMAVELGGGAAIKVKDSSVICHPKVKRTLEDLAEKHGIPYQLEVLERGGTDTGAIHLTRAGVPSGAVSIPCRYIHTASEMVDMKDVRAVVDLLLAFLKDNLEQI